MGKDQQLRNTLGKMSDALSSVSMPGPRIKRMSERETSWVSRVFDTVASLWKGENNQLESWVALPTSFPGGVSRFFLFVKVATRGDDEAFSAWAERVWELHRQMAAASDDGHEFVENFRDDDADMMDVFNLPLNVQLILDALEFALEQQGGE